jgi:hypothetical protein
MGDRFHLWFPYCLFGVGIIGWAWMLAWVFSR